jgi:hypothetical protein
MPPRYTTIDEVSESTENKVKNVVKPVTVQVPVTMEDSVSLYPWKALVWILLMVFLFLFRLLYILSGFHVLASMTMALCATLLTYIFLRFV